jgi:flagellar hook-associated protein 1 FlgK
MGVDIHEIRQIRHLFNDNIYRSESNNLGYWEARSKAIADVEAILGEPMTAGIQSALNNFWDAWQELSKSPESLTTRALLKQRSESLVEHLNHVGTQLNKLQTDLNNEIKTRIDEVNDITESIAKLNVKIMSAEAAGNAPNDYYDERNSLVDRLSKLVKAETWVGQDGNMDILVGGYFLVSKGVQTKLYAAPNEDLSHFYTPKLVGADVAIDVGQGIIKGLLEARGEVDGSKGKFDNGTPNTTADITIAVDTANITPGYLDNIRNYVDKIASDLKARGLNYNLRLLTFGSGTITNTNFGQDAAALSAAIPTTPGTDAGYDIGDIISSVTSAGTFIDDANRYLMVFTGESPNGDGNMATDTQISSWLQSLKRNGITTSVITDSDYFVDGDAGEKGWGILTEQTGGMLYDIRA